MTYKPIKKTKRTKAIAKLSSVTKTTRSNARKRLNRFEIRPITANDIEARNAFIADGIATSPWSGKYFVKHLHIAKVHLLYQLTVSLGKLCIAIAQEVSQA